MKVIILLLITIAWSVFGNHKDPVNCGLYTDGTCGGLDEFEGCLCKCAPGTSGKPYGTGAEFACGSKSPVVGTGWYSEDEVSDCKSHCDNLSTRSTHCNSHGYDTCRAQELGWSAFALYGCDSEDGVHYKDVDSACVDVSAAPVQPKINCRCDPGWMTQHDFTPSCNAACAIRIRDDMCSGRGRDSTGLEAGNGTCGADGDFYFFDPSCGFGWPSKNGYTLMTTEPSMYQVCLCDPGWAGMPNPTTRLGQCSQTVREYACTNHGNPVCTSCQYTSNASISTIPCTCDANSGWTGQQCDRFEPCTLYDCGPHGNCSVNGTGCSSNGPNPKGRCCQCDAGYGDIGCCPLKFGSTVACNGLGVCLVTGNCSCPLGSMAPGCCIGCDPVSQTCREDGRCTCPIINGTECGYRGSYCSEVVQLCICESFVFSAPAISDITVQTGGLFCCPLNTVSGLLCSGRGICTSQPAAELLGTGGCLCQAGYGGAYCCPMAAGQTKACGAHGLCLPDGTCQCDAGVGGPLGACEINYNCQNDPEHWDFECNGGGSCVRNSQTGGPNDMGSYLELLGFADQPNTAYQTHDDTGSFTDEAAIFFIQRYWQAFINTNLRLVTDEGSYYTLDLSECAAGAPSGRGECLWNMIRKCHSQRQDYLQTFSSASVYVNTQVFPYLHSGRTINSAPFFTQVAASLLDACSNGSSLAKEAVASLLLYEVWRMQTPQPLGGSATALAGIQMLPTNIRGYPYQCKCTPPRDTDIIGFSLAPGGKYCQLLCPVGGTAGRLPLQVCSGFENGILRGYCTDEYDDPAGVGDTGLPGIPAPGKCVCGPRFAGNACQYNRAPGCFPLDSVTADACTSARQGTCVQSLDQLNNPIFSCQCTSQFTGPYCQFNKCLPPGVITNTTVECSGRGICMGASQCDCSGYNNGVAQTGSGNIIPFLAGGNACELNITFGCGTFRSNPLGGGTWTLCSEAGSCIVNYNTVPASAACVCDPGRGGSKCALTDCNPGCNGNQVCANSTGSCSCKPFWSTPAGCAAGNRTCECSVSLCKQGTPVLPAATSCTCNSGWKKVPFGNTGVTGGIAGSCDIVQCPLVVHNDQGIRLCNEPTDSRCSDLSSITQSLALGCCVDSCPQCILSGNNTRTCNCGAGASNPNCYTAAAGACFPVCHGNDEGHPNPPNCVNPDASPILCNCNHVSLAANQFRDARCTRYTCANGVRVSTVCIPQQQQCCNCAGTTFTGSFCETANCGGRGTPSQDATFCVCYPPYFRGPGRNDCNLDACSPGTVVGVSPSFTCSCPSNYLIGTSSLSCVALDCAGIHAVQCSACKNGGQAQVVSHAITCSCTGTDYTGSTCTIPICRNGGTNSGTTCICPQPWTGTFCLDHLCQHGGSPINGSTSCSCINGYTGNHCETPPANPGSSSSSVSSTGSSSTNSSSSTAATAIEVDDDVLDDTWFYVGASALAAAMLGIWWYYKIYKPKLDAQQAQIAAYMIRSAQARAQRPRDDAPMPAARVFQGAVFNTRGRAKLKDDEDDIELEPVVVLE
jgi:hypothetical protein